MSRKFIIFVIDILANSGTPEEMKAIDEFNDTLRANQHFIFAGGLSSPENGKVIDNRKGANIVLSQPLFEAKENYSGFWLIEAEDEKVAYELALQGSKACNRKVELRPLLGS
jgi:hypothetical protein